MVRVTGPLKSALGAKTGAEPPPRNVLILATVPLRTIEPVPEPVTVTLPPDNADKVPELTDRFTVTLPVPASTSLMDKLLKVKFVFSLTLNVDVRVFTGGSLTGVTMKLKVLAIGVELSSLPSSTRTSKEAVVVSPPSC
ncbi:hypothetical protein, partial [Synechocystis salina]|uniref:hypothetical protein n=1 Tax=Synechocystis salina TaxID=945780 RepID=UPI001D1508DF